MKRRVWSLLAWLGLLVMIVCLTPAVSWYGRMLAGPWADPDGNTLIVLGASRIEPGIIGRDTYWRVVYGLRAYRGHGFDRILLSGAEVSESMRDYLAFQGVPQEKIHVETRSLSTRENALFAQPLLAGWPGPVVLMTSDYHMFRARRVFARCGVQVLARPIPDAVKRAGNWPERWSVFLDEAVETGKIAYYFVRGWI